MQASILDALFIGNKGAGQVNSQCPTPYCRWPNFRTLGVCYKCNDITSRLARHDNWGTFQQDQYPEESNVSAYFLPNGAYLANVDGTTAGVEGGNQDIGYAAQMMGLATGHPNETVSMTSMTTLIWSLSAVYMNQTIDYENYNSWPNLSVLATECALFYCGLEVSSKFDNNTLTETSHELDFVRDSGSWQIEYAESFHSLPANVSESIVFDPFTAAMYRSDLRIHDPKNSSSSLSISPPAVYSISSYFQSNFQSNSTLPALRVDGGSLSIRSPDKPKGNANIGYYSMGGESLPRMAKGIWNVDSTNLSVQFDAMSRGMTSAIRNASPTKQDLSSIPNGEVGQQTTVYAVQWGWIALHALLIAGRTSFFIATVRSSAGAEKLQQCLPWKSSSLAIISKAAELGPLFEPTDSLRQLEEKAERQRATFNKKEGERLDPSLSE